MRSQVRFLSRVVRPELKYIITPALTTGQNTTWRVVKIASVDEGTGDTERIGVKINVVGITLRGFVLGSGTAHNQRCRIIVIANKKDNSNNLVAGDVFPSSSSTPIEEFKIHDQRFKTKILYDKVFNVAPNDLTVTNSGSAQITGGGGPVCRTIRHHIRLNHTVRYNTTDSTGATIEDGGLYVMCAGNNGSDAEGPLVSLDCKLSFYDT